MEYLDFLISFRYKGLFLMLVKYFRFSGKYFWISSVLDEDWVWTGIMVETLVRRNRLGVITVNAGLIFCLGWCVGLFWCFARTVCLANNFILLGFFILPKLFEQKYENLIIITNIQFSFCEVNGNFNFSTINRNVATNSIFVLSFLIIGIS